MGDDAIFDEEGEQIFEQTLHLHVGVLLFFVDGANHVIIGLYVLVFGSVIWWLFHLDEIVHIEIFFGERGEIVDAVGLACEVGQSEEEKYKMERPHYCRLLYQWWDIIL